MNGVYENAVLTALKGHFNLSEIVLCTDNDEGGIDAVDRLTDILRGNGYDRIFRMASKFKDWNEDLKAQHWIEPLPSEPHHRKEKYYETVSALKYFTCTPDRLSERLTKAFKSGEYQCLAEYALAGSAFFIGRKDERTGFERLKSKLANDYRAYSDRGKLRSKQDNLKSSLHIVLQDFKQNSARTQEQTMKTAKSLFMLADCAVKADVEEQLTAQIQMQALEQNEQSEEISEGMCLGYG